jgi:tRNA A-37 threonylcarbamoyl transferase component Bud32
MADIPQAVATALQDRYRIERELGRGGMATVYLAQDLKHDRRVALKLLHPELATTLGPERFLREIHLTARLDHPHILPVFDSGAAGGLLWYTMPYVEGESLRDRLRREGQLPVEDTIRIAREVADALECAHQHGIVHRDIKPENILLSRDHARVADFGVARAVEAAGAGQLTETGLVVGTPAYMSPEQASGGPVDARSDLYALGCVLYEMLAGEAPYTGPTAQAIVAKAAAAPVPSLRPVRPDVPGAVDQAIRRALAKSPAGRFATAGEFSAALRSGGRRDGPPRHKWLAGVTAALLLAGLIWGALGRHSHVKPTLGLLPRLAVLPFRTVGDSSAPGFAEGLTEELTQRLGSLGGLRVIASGSARRAAELGLSAREAGESLGAPYLLTGTVRQAGSSTGEVRLRVTPLSSAHPMRPRSGARHLIPRLPTPSISKPLSALAWPRPSSSRFPMRNDSGSAAGPPAIPEPTSSCCAPCTSGWLARRLALRSGRRSASIPRTAEQCLLSRRGHTSSNSRPSSKHRKTPVATTCADFSTARSR